MTALQTKLDQSGFQAARNLVALDRHDAAHLIRREARARGMSYEALLVEANEAGRLVLTCMAGTLEGSGLGWQLRRAP